MDALEDLGINELNDAFAVGTTDPMAVTRHLLDRIERLDQKLGAFEAVLAESAMLAAEGAAKAISSGHRIGPFHGVPFVLKDLVHVEGTTAAFHVMILTMTVWLMMFMSMNVKKGYVNGIIITKIH